MSGFAIARSHNLHFLDPSEENVISYWLPSSPLFLLRLPFCVFHCRHQSSRAQTRLHVHVRARHFLATFPRRINARSCAGVSKEPMFSLNGHDPPPFCRERKSILSLSLRNRFDLFSMLQIPLRYFLALRLLKRTPQESKYQSKYPKAGKHLYPFVLYTTDLSWNNT